jgi:Fe-S cluster assembly protein SufD
MTAVASERTAFRALFEERNSRGRPDPPWLPVHRREAMERFEELGFPSTRVEEWRYTSTAALARAAFSPAGPASPPVETGSLAVDAAVTSGRIVIANGRHVAERSAVPALPGVTVASLAGALRQFPDRLAPYLSQVAPVPGNAFAALNTALFEDGVCVIVDPDAVLPSALHMVFLAVPGEARMVSQPRVLVLAGRGSEVAVVEEYLGADGSGYWTNAVTEIVLEDGARVDRYKLQREGRQATHIGALCVELGRDSRFSDHSFSLGAALSRHDIEVRLSAPGAECQLDGLFMVRGDQHTDTHSRIDHLAPHCASRELYKGVLDGSSRGVFHGRIVVRPGAQKTDAEQSNKNLLLSRDALVHSTPQLEIFADDVKCKHGSTTGQVDAAALFYLRSRGLAEATARSMLTWGFAGELATRGRRDLRGCLEGVLREGLPGPVPEVAA